ncbi:MAG: HAMP domain-containing histidine kinase [Flavobacteriales bacterium]|nr:HAMP domain-containing histidine kinase [Flavobacteriales bacterium]
MNLLYLMLMIQNTLFLKWLTIFVSIIIVTLILWNTYNFFVLFKIEERAKMEIIASAQKELASNKDLNASTALPLAILENNSNIPLILVDENGVISSWENLDSIKAQDPDYLQEQLEIMKSENTPIAVPYTKNKMNYVYYRNSDLLNRLTYYPIALILILGLFLTVIYMMFTSSKIAEQNKLWTGMAKETAHQIGTPLSSLLGWIAILKTENVHDKYVKEIENDVYRLNTIASRFSKIGSLPELKQGNIVGIIRETYDYLELRSSKQISFSFVTSKEEIHTNLNQELVSWVIENLITNAIDAMQGKGSVAINISSDAKRIKILVADTGKGMTKSQFKQIFKPGYTTKKRGWGLGLSLSKRIIEDYHKGKIFVKKSEIGKGTVFQVTLNKIGSD